jgi:DNA-directed RNA polymerase specialized sigma24 family protein
MLPSDLVDFIHIGHLHVPLTFVFGADITVVASLLCDFCLDSVYGLFRYILNVDNIPGHLAFLYLYASRNPDYCCQPMEALPADHIIQGIRTRDDRVFKYLQVKFQDSIRLMVLEMGGSPEDAKDVFNEGLISLIRLVDGKDFKLTCKIGTLLYAVCNKIWKQELEKQTAARNYHLRKLETTSDSDFTEDYDEKLYHGIFWECFQRLEKVCKDILSDYFREISPMDIAANRGYSYGYVRKKKSICYSYLIKLIEENPMFIRIRRAGKAATVV